VFWSVNSCVETFYTIPAILYWLQYNIIIIQIFFFQVFGHQFYIYVTIRTRTYAFWRLLDYCIFIDRSLETRVLSSSANGELILNMSPAYYCLPFWPPNYVSQTNPKNNTMIQNRTKLAAYKYIIYMYDVLMHRHTAFIPVNSSIKLSINVTNVIIIFVY